MIYSDENNVPKNAKGCNNRVGRLPLTERTNLCTSGLVTDFNGKPSSPTVKMDHLDKKIHISRTGRITNSIVHKLLPAKRPFSANEEIDVRRKETTRKKEIAAGTTTCIVKRQDAIGKKKTKAITANKEIHLKDVNPVGESKNEIIRTSTETKAKPAASKTNGKDLKSLGNGKSEVTKHVQSELSEKFGKRDSEMGEKMRSCKFFTKMQSVYVVVERMRLEPENIRKIMLRNKGATSNTLTAYKAASLKPLHVIIQIPKQLGSLSSITKNKIVQHGQNSTAVKILAMTDEKMASNSVMSNVRQTTLKPVQVILDNMKLIDTSTNPGAIIVESANNQNSIINVGNVLEISDNGQSSKGTRRQVKLKSQTKKLNTFNGRNIVLNDICTELDKDIWNPTVLIKNTRNVQKIFEEQIVQSDVLECRDCDNDKGPKSHYLVTYDVGAKALKNTKFVLHDVEPQLAECDNMKKPRLRLRKTRNYAELSLEESPKPETNVLKSAHHVPIYKQAQEECRVKEKADLYEFDSDSEKKKGKKRKKTSFNDSITFDKDMKTIMQNIEKKYKAARLKTKNKQVLQNKNNKKLSKAKAIKFIKLLQECAKTNNRSQQRAVDKIQSEKHVNVPNAKIISSNKIFNTEFNFSTQPVPKNVRDHSSDSEKFFGFSNDDIITLRINSESNGNVKRALVPEKSSAHPPVIVEDDSTDSDSFFGFDDNSVSEIEKNKNSGVNVISNVMLRRKNVRDLGELDLDLSVHFRRPNANSTMIGKPKSKCTGSPWRPDLDVRRNPHLLQIKETLLPNYNQDMVLDSTIVEKNCTNHKSTPVLGNEQKGQQRTILDYVSTDKLLHNETVQDCSLFDSADFSPIKTRTHTPKENEIVEDQSAVAETLPTQRVKRNILSERVTNILQTNRNTSTPLKNLNKKNRRSDKENYEVDNYFGFDTIIEEGENDEEHVHVVTSKKKREINAEPENDIRKPVRYDELVKEIIKQKKVVNDKQPDDEINEADEENNLEAVEGDLEVVENKESENEPLSGKLFEDLEPESHTRPSLRSYAGKRMKRLRQCSIEVDHDEDEEFHPKRKKRNLRTKEEEKKANHWAEAFNSMCQEVEEFELEIE